MFSEISYQDIASDQICLIFLKFTAVNRCTRCKGGKHRELQTSVWPSVAQCYIINHVKPPPEYIEISVTAQTVIVLAIDVLY